MCLWGVGGWGVEVSVWLGGWVCVSSGCCCWWWWCVGSSVSVTISGLSPFLKMPSCVVVVVVVGFFWGGLRLVNMF